MGVNGKLLTQDIDTILYKILNASGELKNLISGQIYKEGYRPTNSGKEDVSIKTLAITQDQPQIAISNINCHVPDRKETIGAALEYVPNSAKMKAVGEMIKKTIDEALINPLYQSFSVRVDDQKTFKNQDTEVREHFQNIRIELIIPNT